MERELKKKSLATFVSLNVGAKQTVQLKFKLRYDEILTSVELLQGLNTDITVRAKAENSSPVTLGLFTIGSVNFDKDGNATILFKSLVQNVNLDKICSVVDEEFIQLSFKAVIELPDSSVSEGGESEWEE